MNTVKGICSETYKEEKKFATHTVNIMKERREITKTHQRTKSWTEKYRMILKKPTNVQYDIHQRDCRVQYEHESP